VQTMVQENAKSHGYFHWWNGGNRSWWSLQTRSIIFLVKIIARKNKLVWIVGGWLLVRHGNQGCMSSLCISSWETFSWHPQITLEGDGLIHCGRQSQHYDNAHCCCCFCFDLAKIDSTFWRWWPLFDTLLVIISRLE
jgi:hypothetical protein